MMLTLFKSIVSSVNVT